MVLQGESKPNPLNPLDSNIYPGWPSWAGRPFGPPAMASSEHMPPPTLPGVCEDLELPLRPVELCVETLEIDRLRGTAKLLFWESSRACRFIACYRYNKADPLHLVRFHSCSILLLLSANGGHHTLEYLTLIAMLA